MRIKMMIEKKYLKGKSLNIREIILFFLLFFFILFGTGKAEAQQFPVYSQYMMNGFLLNPAVAGHEGYTAINITGREQWLGIKDAPSTYALSVQTRLLKNSFISRSASIKRRRRVMSRSGRVGMGLYVFSDRNGAFNRTGVQYTYSYHLSLRRSLLSFGASLTGYQFRIDDEKIRLYTEDQFYYNMDKSAMIPDANFGVYYSDRNLYAGFSALQLFENTFKLTDKGGADFKMIRHYFAMAGYRFMFSETVYIEPSFLLKTTERFVSQLDFNAKLYIKEDYWAGLSYRTGGNYSLSEESLRGGGSSIIIMGGARFDKFYFGYAFDYNLSAVSSYSIGSHELMLGVRFGDSARRYRWLNRY
jgi:type IX secretion system PorP/SprF family membrane protein